MKLILVPTPIGNLEDITLRAIRVLQEADAVLAEDTRVSGQLLKHLGIQKPLLSFHAHNEHKTLPSVMERLRDGETLALVSDAGTPGISDPAFLLVRECIRMNIPVECLPGPTALIPALVLSGLPCDEFLFAGFFPVKKGRSTLLTSLSEEQRTLIIYESPHRILRTLRDLVNALGPDRRASLSRELSKLHEETLRGTLSELLGIVNERSLKGEMVLVVEGRIPKKKSHAQKEE